MKRTALLIPAVTLGLAASGLAASAATTPAASHHGEAPLPQASLHLVALHSKADRATIAQLFGRRAIWAFDPRTGRFRSVVNFAAPRGETVYAFKSHAEVLSGQTAGLGPSVRFAASAISGTAGSEAVIAAGRSRRARRGSTRASAPTTTALAPTTTAPAPTTTAPAPTTTAPAPTTTAPATPAPTTPAPTTPAPSSSPSASSSPTGSASLLPASGTAGPWHTVFDDEFNGTSLDTANWTPYWFSNGSTSNGTTMISSNVSVSNGSLDLRLNGSGGLVSSNGKFQFTYGYVEARVYVPASGGSVANWPAVWADGQSWPADGELDVMEGLGGQACFHFHSNAGGPGGCAAGSYVGWHTFGADWEPGSVTYYYDGQAVGTITTGITSQPMYLIMENSGGSYGGPSVQPSDMLVDYVRVWQH